MHPKTHCWEDYTVLWAQRPVGFEPVNLWILIHPWCRSLLKHNILNCCRKRHSWTSICNTHPIEVYPKAQHPAGFEPMTFGLRGVCLTAVLQLSFFSRRVRFRRGRSDGGPAAAVAEKLRRLWQLEDQLRAAAVPEDRTEVADAVPQCRSVAVPTATSKLVQLIMTYRFTKISTVLG